MALLIGAVAATGAYALIDNDGADKAQSSRVIVVHEPAPAGAGVAAKDEAATAAAIATEGIEARGSKASALAPQTAPTSGIEARGSKASALAPQTAPASGIEARGSKASAQTRTDPHGPAQILNSTP